MSNVGNSFSPMDAGEIEVFSFDFVNEIVTGDTVSSPEWSASEPGKIEIIGPSSISGTVVSQRMKALAGGILTVGCYVTTSSGAKKHLYADLQISSAV